MFAKMDPDFIAKEKEKLIRTGDSLPTRQL